MPVARIVVDSSSNVHVSMHRQSNIVLDCTVMSLLSTISVNIVEHSRCLCLYGDIQLHKAP
jgi:hypothetical protein